MKKILLLTAILVAALAVNAWADAPATGDIDVTVTANYLGYLQFDDATTSSSTTLNFDDYELGSKVLGDEPTPDPNVEDDTLEYWANSSSTITFDVAVTSVSSGSGGMSGTVKFDGDGTSYGDGDPMPVVAGTSTFDVDNYTINGITWGGTPPDTYTVTYTGTIADS